MRIASTTGVPASMTGEYDYQLRLACLDPAEFETVVDRLKREHGVRELRSRLVSTNST
ncbi:Lrp/AsnC ligand binding domain-containing protein [Amycolatopsis sp. NPDC023774]|uniref:Lrp/AsnC ligand binding domain-containing protein n=1 Tax=Amycolatopsis sp. NPDC023774 TaxID=3155015 RepID=UPI0033CB453C